MERGFDIFYIVVVSIALILIFLTVFRRKRSGELLVTLEKSTIKGRKIEMTSAFVFLPIWVVLLIYSIKTSKGNGLSLGAYIYSCIFWILMCVLNITRKEGTSEIREKGLYIYNSFYRYSKMNSYTWLEGDVLRVNYINIFRQDDYVELEIKDKDTVLKADEVLGRYINKKV